MAENDFRRVGHVVPRVDDSVKVRLPGETPWATCVKVYEDGTWQGRIDNWLFAQRTDQQRAEAILQAGGGFGGGEPLPSLHDFRQGDIVLWKWVGDGWEPAEPASGVARQ